MLANEKATKLFACLLPFCICIHSFQLNFKYAKLKYIKLYRLVLMYGPLNIKIELLSWHIRKLFSNYFWYLHLQVFFGHFLKQFSGFQIKYFFKFCPNHMETAMQVPFCKKIPPGEILGEQGSNCPPPSQMVRLYNPSKIESKVHFKESVTISVSQWSILSPSWFKRCFQRMFPGMEEERFSIERCLSKTWEYRPKTTPKAQLHGSSFL